MAEARLDADEIVARVRSAEGDDGRLPVPDVVEWEIFPWEGQLLSKRVDDPAPERPRAGEAGGGDCWICARPDDACIWVDEHWRVGSTEPAAVPMADLSPRDHLDLGDLDDQMAAELGTLVVRLERAMAEIPGVGRVHVNKWGDGGAHLHMIFLARPARMLQLRGPCLPEWMDILPALPADQCNAIADQVGATLATWRGNVPR